MWVFFFVLLVPQRLSEAEHAVLLAPKYNAKIEVVLWDKTRADLMNSTYAIEIDFGKKWAEAIGQSLYYSILTGKKPAIILLIGKDESRFAYRCQTVCAKIGIKLFVEKVRFR